MPGDILWDNVAFLSSFDGENGASVFIDEGPEEHVVTTFGTPITSNIQAKFGQTSGQFIGGNDQVRVADNAAFDLANNDFTIEAWVWWDSAGSGGGSRDSICGVWTDTTSRGWLLQHNHTANSIAFLYSTNGSNTNELAVAYGVDFTDNAWNHVAVTRFGNTLLFHVNGVFIGSHALSATIFLPSSERFGIGGLGTSDWTGYIDELRVTIGAVRYPFAEDFDPPDAAFERGPETSATLTLNDVTTLVYFLKFEAPNGNALLCDGGQMKFGSEVYQSQDDAYGSIHTPEALDMGFGDLSEAGQITLTPAGDADIADWWRDDLFDSRIRIWMGELDADDYTVSEAELLGDFLVDTYKRRQGAGGLDLLEIELISRAEKLFLINEGNVLSQRFHQTVFPGEKGLNNMTDTPVPLAWGAATPDRGSASSSGGTFNTSLGVRT